MEIDERKLYRRVDTEGNFTRNEWNAAGWLLSQSAMKAFVQAREGRLCPIVFKEHCLTFNLQSKSGEAAQKGQYFEWLATGSKPAYGDEVPIPETYKRSGEAGDGRKYFAGETKPDWILPETQAANFHKALKELGLKILKAGAKLAYKGCHGNIDIILQVERERWDEVVGSYLKQEMFSVAFQIDLKAPTWEECQWRDENGSIHYGCIVVDLKYSALMDDRWNDSGWDLDRLGEKTDTMTQAKHYHWLSGGLPFFFWVFSSKDEDSKMIRILFDSHVLKSHTDDVENAVKLIKAEMQTDGRDPDWPAFWRLKDGRPYLPTLKVCNECPLRDGCPKRAQGPRIYAVHAS